ncbi:MAG: hypothetical protein Q7S22_00010 [Candidatus Micrarchaeota archaeon]|nr:hypothetical protein [Candidatus Micrarchaeota archaeon]
MATRTINRTLLHDRLATALVANKRVPEYRRDIALPLVERIAILSNVEVALTYAQDSGLRAMRTKIHTLNRGNGYKHLTNPYIAKIISPIDPVIPHQEMLSSPLAETVCEVQGKNDTGTFISSLLDVLPQYTAQERFEAKGILLMVIERAVNQEQVMKIIKASMEAWGINHLKQKLAFLKMMPKARWLKLNMGDSISRIESKRLCKTLGLSLDSSRLLPKGDKATKFEVAMRLNLLMEISPDKTIAEYHFSLIRARFGINPNPAHRNSPQPKPVSLMHLTGMRDAALPELIVQIEEAIELVEDLARKVDFEKIHSLDLEELQIKLIRNIHTALEKITQVLRTRKISELSEISELAKTRRELESE